MIKETANELMLCFGENIFLPVVTQDYQSKEVLLVAFTNKEAFERTIKTGYATYWSRSRNKLWTKGETSGEKLRIVGIRVNCEQNSLLYLVEMEGNSACHTKNRSCYYRRLTKKGKLEF